MASMRLGMVLMTIIMLCLLSKITQSAYASRIVDIPDFENNRTVIKLVHYALTDWNAAHNAGLTFEKVVGAQLQAVTRKEAIYYILIRVLDARNFVVVYSAQILYGEDMDPWVQIFTPLLAPAPL